MDQINLSRKKVLVTGGNGYLGRKLIDRSILEEAKVFSLDLHDTSLNEKVSYFKVDLRNKNKLIRIIQKIKPSIIYHLAASLDRTRDFTNTERIFEINLFGTINLLNALKEINYEKLIFTSTSEVYGGTKAKPPFKEEDNFVPASPYSLSKYYAEMAIRSFSELYHKKFIILRLFNFYGEGMSSQFFLPQLIEKLTNGENFNMTMGEQIRDFIHIDDVLRAMLLATDINVYNEVFNVCNGTGISIRDLALKIKEILKSNSQINFGAIPYRKNEVWDMIGDNSRILEKLGFKIEKDLFEGMSNDNSK